MEIQESKTGAVLVVTLQGRLDANTSQSAQEKISALLDRGDKLLVMDLAGIEHISSAGLRIFMTSGKRLKNAGGKLVFCALQDYTKELFEIAGFTSLFSIYATRDEAVAKILAA